MSAGDAPPARHGPFVGLRVIELAGIGPAQLGCLLLADLGADVIRLDRCTDTPAEPPERPSTEVLARGRRSLAVDLKAAAGVELALALMDGADVVVDPYRPGVVERLGIGPESALARNPRLVYARMTGWGQTGPLARAAGHDINYIAVAGALDAIGSADDLPQVPLNVIGDYGGGGMLLAFAVAAALHERSQSGRGQVIDVAMVDGVAALLGSVLQLRASGDWTTPRGSNWLQGAAPWYGVYRTRDERFLTVGSLEGKFYAELLERLGLDPGEWPQWDRERWPPLRARLETIFAARTLGEWQCLLEGTDACFGAALTLEEVSAHPQLAARETYVTVDGVLQAAPVPRFSRTPGALSQPPPWPGQHTLDVLEELGIEPAHRDALLSDAVVAFTPSQ